MSNWSSNARMGSPTFATQLTRAPLKSRVSSFSTAVLRSAAVSNSTNLCCKSANIPYKTSQKQRRTLHHCHCGRFRNKQRRGQIGGRNLSDPISRVHVSRSPGFGSLALSHANEPVIKSGKAKRVRHADISSGQLYQPNRNTKQ